MANPPTKAVATKAVVRVHESRLKKKKHMQGAGGHGGGASAERWLLTYADMITLLLALFIILFAISTPNKVKYDQLAKAMSGGFGGTNEVNVPTAGVKGASHISGNAAAPGTTKSTELQKLDKQMSKLVKQSKMQKTVKLHMEARGLVITLLSDRANYDSGSAALRPDVLTLLDHASVFLGHLDNEVRIEGNTDNVPIATAEYPSNWELSAARAITVTRYLVEHAHLDPRRLSAAGYGQYKSAVPNDTDAHRQLNRRVDIVILNTRMPKEEKKR